MIYYAKDYEPRRRRSKDPLTWPQFAEKHGLPKSPKLIAEGAKPVPPETLAAIAGSFLDVTFNDAGKGTKSGREDALRIINHRLQAALRRTAKYARALLCASLHPTKRREIAESYARAHQLVHRLRKAKAELEAE